MSTLLAVGEPAQSAATVEVTQRSRLFLWIFPALGVCSLITACAIWSLKKQMWADEVFTRTEISDPSLIHLLRALPRLGGGGMPLFSLTAWPWAHVFGLSDCVLRLYSSAGICGAFLVLVAALRRQFTMRASFLGVAFGIFACMPLMEQNAEARAYGLYLLLCALAIAQWLRIAQTERSSRRELALLLLTQAALVLGHVLALVYAGLMLAALVAADVWQRRFRLRVYLCCAAGWLALAPWIPAIRASMAVGKPRGWILAPNLGDLVMGASLWLFSGIYYPLAKGHSAGLVIGWAMAIFCVAALLWAGIRRLRSAPQQRPVFLLGIALTLAPLLFFLVSRLSTPIFVARYMVPSALGVALLAVGWAERSRAVAGKTGTVLAAAIVLLPVLTAALAKPLFLNVAEIDRIAAGRPVICQGVRDFTVMERYSAHPASVQYPLDWAAAVSGPGIEIGGYHLLQNYRQEGYLTANVRDGAEILRQPSFLLLDDGNAHWFSAAIEHNPQWTWTVLTQVDQDHRLIEVDQKR